MKEGGRRDANNKEASAMPSPAVVPSPDRLWEAQVLTLADGRIGRARNQAEMGLPGELGRAGEMLGVISAYQWGGGGVMGGNCCISMGRGQEEMKTIVQGVQNPGPQELDLFLTCSEAI